MAIKLANNASSTLATAISASDTGIVLATGSGSRFPVLATGDYFYATLVSTAGTREIVKVTARVGDTLTIVRAQDGTTAASFAAGAQLELRVSAAAVLDLATSGALGALGGPSGSSLVGYLPVGSGAVATTVQAKLREIVSVKDFGAVGDGTTNDTAAIQNSLNHLASLGGGTLVVPWPSAKYLITSTISVPSHIEIRGLGATDPSGDDGSQFRYSGTDAAFALGNDVASNCRGVSLQNIGVVLTAAGSTGFRIRRARDVRVDGCAVDMGADSQTGFLLDGKRISTTATGAAGQFTITVAATTDLVAGQVVFGTNIGTGAVVAAINGFVVTLSVANSGTVSGAVGFGSAGVFDCNFYRLSSYCNAAHTNAIHYKLDGSDASGSSGRCNANQFYGIRGGGAGKGIEIGPSLINSFYGVEFESLSNHYIHCLGGAENNSIYDAYLGDNGNLGGNKLFYCESGAVGNQLVNYRAGSAGAGALYLGPANNNQAIHILGDKFVGAATARAWNVRVPGEAFNRVEVRGDSVLLGTGAASPITVVPRQTLDLVDFNSTLGTYNPNINTGRIKSVRLMSGSTGTLTFAAVSNSSIGDELTIHIFNSSGGALSLAWSSTDYIKTAGLPTSIANGARISLVIQRISTATLAWIQVGPAVTMA